MSLISKDFIQILKNSLSQKVPKVAPGLLEILNLYCRSKLGKDFYTLLAENPCTLYKSLISFYRDETSVNIILKIVLRTIINDEESLEIALDYAKSCKAKEFTETLYKTLSYLTH